MELLQLKCFKTVAQIDKISEGEAVFQAFVQRAYALVHQYAIMRWTGYPEHPQL